MSQHKKLIPIAILATVWALTGSATTSSVQAETGVVVAKSDAIQMKALDAVDGGAKEMITPMAEDAKPTIKSSNAAIEEPIQDLTEGLTQGPKQGPTPTIDGMDWRAEEAAVAKMEQLFEAALEVKQIEADKKAVDLNAVGRSYTANTIDALKTTDFVVGPFQLSKPINEAALSDDMMALYKALGGSTEGRSKSVFTTYSGEAGSYTVYTGPLQVKERILRNEGLAYDLPNGAVTNIHITGGDFETDRNVAIGASRGTVLFAYGAPQAIWRDTKKNSVSLVYAKAVEKKENSKQDFASTVANLGNKTVLNERLTETDTSSGYIIFTLVDNKVTAIDFMEGQVRAKLSLPSTEYNHFKANQLSSRDFVLMGYEVNVPFVTNPDDSWQQRGLIYGSDFLSYDDVLIGYDQSQLISRVMITKSTAVTRRGISIGDSKYLLLYLYGMPSTIESDTAKNGDQLQIYTYKNPMSIHSYLIFVIGEKDNFIKSVMLSDRPHKELEL
ncbi:hypothetical protein [uncultured Veillonella sp.]|uniref:hypothetical protein n=1 Tax=uncultured Veillonella sp. TaxID=159268 RepID=UPI00260F8B33|nr:hypothetical protein [uncultured Veillonella sp.]